MFKIGTEFRKFLPFQFRFSYFFFLISGNEEALEGRAAVCLQMGNTYAAFQDLNAAIRINPTAELYNNRGVVNQVRHFFFVGDVLRK